MSASRRRATPAQKPVAKAESPVPQEFKQRPDVRRAVALYAKKPHLSYGSGDLAGYAATQLKALAAAGDLDPVFVTTLMSAAQVNGAQEFTPQESSQTAGLLRELRKHEPVLKRMVAINFPAEAPGLKPNLGRRLVVHRLALIWQGMGLRVGVSHNASAMTANKSASGPFIRAALAATEDLPKHQRLTANAIDAEVKALRRAGELGADKG